MSRTSKFLQTSTQYRNTYTIGRKKNKQKISFKGGRPISEFYPIISHPKTPNHLSEPSSPKQGKNSTNTHNPPNAIQPENQPTSKIIPTNHKSK
jgi:hypothetical protein